jgi:hypothetical protein
MQNGLGMSNPCKILSCLFLLYLFYILVTENLNQNAGVTTDVTSKFYCVNSDIQKYYLFL